MKKYLLLTIFFPVLFYAQNICDIAINPVCSSDTFDVEAPNSDFDGFITSCDNATYPMEDVAWYHVRILEGTTFTFMLQIQLGHDYDFAVWLNPDCSDLGPADRASFIHEPDAGATQTGLKLNEPDTCEGLGTDWANTPGMVRHLNVQPGDNIYIMIYRPPNVTTGDFSVVFEGTGGDATLDCTIVGDSYGKCDMDANQEETFVAADFLPDLNDDFPGSQYEFYYDQDGAEDGVGTQVTFPHTVNTADDPYPGQLFVRVENAGGDFQRAVQIFLYVNELPQITTPIDLPPLCDIGDDGTEPFDLTQAETDLVTDPTLYTFLYYETEEDAEAGGNNNINPENAYDSGTGTVWVRVQSGPMDGNEDGCFSIGEINLTLLEFEVESVELTIDPVCDDDGDGFVTFDLTENEPDLVANPEDYDISYHTDPVEAETGDNPIGTPANYNVPAGQTIIIYVRIKSQENECYRVSEIHLTTVQRPVLIALDDVSFCTDETPGEYMYDLTEFAPLIVANNEDYNITYYESQEDAEVPENAIGTPTTYPVAYNTPVTIFIRVEADGCHDIGEVEILINTNPELNQIQVEPFCADAMNGTTPYDLTQHAEDIIDNPEDFDITYYESQEDAETPQNEIGTPDAYPLPVGATTEIFVRVENPLTLCYKITSFTIESMARPELLALDAPIELCDPDFDGDYEYDLTGLNELLINPTTGLIFAYYASQQDFDNDIQIPENQWGNYPMMLPTTILVVATTEEGCRSESVEVDFIIGDEVQHNPGPFDAIGYCQSEEINLTQYEGDMGTEADIDFTYYETLGDAENGVNPIQNTNPYNPDGSGSIFVRLEKDDRCPVIIEITYELLPSPSIEGLGPLSQVICEGEETIEIEAGSDDPNATYLWEWGNGQNQTDPVIEITEPGTYTITVTGENGCETTEQLTIAPSPEPVITLIESGTDYLIVTAESGGGGHLEYSLNGVIWQDSPRFDNLIKGEIYTVYVRENGCMVVSYQVVILDITNFVSPNGDGYNDTWAVRGIEVTPEATIKIFDRYGKLFVDTNFDGNYVWDGKYNGSNLPSGDYWYIMDVPSDGIVTAKKFIGHVSIRNQ